MQCSFICVGERRTGRETEPGSSPWDVFSDLEFRGGGCSPSHPDQGGAHFPSQLFAPTPWPPNHCQMCPCCWIFPASPQPLSSQLLPQWYLVHPCRPSAPLPSLPQLWELLSGRKWSVSSWTSWGILGVGRKGAGSLACTRSHLPYIQEWLNPKVFPADVTPEQPTAAALMLVLAPLPTSWVRWPPSNPSVAQAYMNQRKLDHEVKTCRSRQPSLPSRPVDRDGGELQPGTKVSHTWPALPAPHPMWIPLTHPMNPSSYEPLRGSPLGWVKNEVGQSQKAQNSVASVPREVRGRGKSS